MLNGYNGPVTPELGNADSAHSDETKDEVHKKAVSKKVTPSLK